MSTFCAGGHCQEYLFLSFPYVYRKELHTSHAPITLSAFFCLRRLNGQPASRPDHEAQGNEITLSRRITGATAQVVLFLERFECLEYDGAREGVVVSLESLKIADCGLLTGTTISYLRSITIAAVEV